MRPYTVMQKRCIRNKIDLFLVGPISLNHNLEIGKTRKKASYGNISILLLVESIFSILSQRFSLMCSFLFLLLERIFHHMVKPVLCLFRSFFSFRLQSVLCPIFVASETFWSWTLYCSKTNYKASIHNFEV